MAEDQKFCVNCGYPEGGTEQQQSSYHARRVLKKRRGTEASKKIRSGRNSLFVIAAFTLAIGVFYFIRYGDNATLITNAILAIIYMVLGFWSQKRPLIALILGLLVYLTTIVLNGILEPETIYKGIIIKVLIILYLSKGINSALQIRNTL